MSDPIRIDGEQGYIMHSHPKLEALLERIAKALEKLVELDARL